VHGGLGRHLLLLTAARGRQGKVRGNTAKLVEVVLLLANSLKGRQTNKVSLSQLTTGFSANCRQIELLY
jgi:hypothetical protein